MTRIWWIVLAAGISGCAPVAYDGPGRFCDVVQGEIVFPRAVAEVVVAGARAEAVRIDAQNRYWEANCR